MVIDISIFLPKRMNVQGPTEQNISVKQVYQYAYRKEDAYRFVIISAVILYLN